MSSHRKSSGRREPGDEVEVIVLTRAHSARACYSTSTKACAYEDFTNSTGSILFVQDFFLGGGGGGEVVRQWP